jgi:hypothetical protein
MQIYFILPLLHIMQTFIGARHVGIVACATTLPQMVIF